MDRTTLLSIFLQQKDELTKKIAQAASSRDLESVRSTIARFFDTQFSPSGEYASQLTQAEFFIMQSSTFINDLQKKLDEQFILAPVREVLEVSEAKAKMTSAPMAFAYSTFGGIIGALAGSAWASLAGAIAGLVLSTLLYKHQPDFITRNKYTQWIIARPTDEKETRNTVNYPELNTPEIMKIFEEICAGIDEMMHVVSSQMKSSAPQTPKPKPIAQELGPILRECQKHIGFLQKAGINADTIGVFEDVWLAIGVEFVHYNKDNSNYFIEKTTQNTGEISELYPAVLINGQLHLQGLISLPDNK